ncbi:MAG: PcfJ domain-containing protein [Henriciella sp.]|nr:PcfJ domain-containing protein [Henriciella sp.]
MADEINDKLEDIRRGLAYSLRLPPEQLRDHRATAMAHLAAASDHARRAAENAVLQLAVRSAHDLVTERCFDEGGCGAILFHPGRAQRAKIVCSHCGTEYVRTVMPSFVQHRSDDDLTEDEKHIVVPMDPAITKPIADLHVAWMEKHQSCLPDFRSEQRAYQLLRCHPDVINWAQAAPVIIFFLLANYSTEASRNLVRSMAGAGNSTREVMKILKLSWPMRKLTMINDLAYALSLHEELKMLRCLESIDPRVLGNSIQSMSGSVEWIRRATNLLAGGVRDMGMAWQLDQFNFMLCHIAHFDLEQIHHYRDFIRDENVSFDPRWTAQEFLKAVKRWEETFVSGLSQSELIERFGPDHAKPISIAPLPETWTDEKTGLTCQALLTGPKLHEEGQIMKHCVGSYWSDVKMRHTVIYSVRDADGKRVSTLEISLNSTGMPIIEMPLTESGSARRKRKERARTYRDAAGVLHIAPDVTIRQHKARANRSPDEAAQKTARRLVHLINKGDILT